MKIKISKDQVEQVHTFVKENPNCTQSFIAEKLGMAKPQVFEALNELKTGKQIAEERKGKTAIKYTVVAAPAKAEKAVPAKAKAKVVAPKAPAKATKKIAAKTAKKETKEVKEVKMVVTPAPPKTSPEDGRNFGRNFSRFLYNGQSFHKGKLVHTAIEDYVKANPSTTIAELRVLFPDALLKTYGVFKELSEAKEKPGRYFTNKSIHLAGGKRIAVCNQWTSENIQPTLAVLKKLGMKITAEKA